MVRSRNGDAGAGADGAVGAVDMAGGIGTNICLDLCVLYVSCTTAAITITTTINVECFSFAQPNLTLHHAGSIDLHAKRVIMNKPLLYKCIKSVTYEILHAYAGTHWMNPPPPNECALPGSAT